MIRFKSLAVPLVVAAFSGFDVGSQEELKAENEHEEVIYRLRDEHYAPPFTFKKQERDPYPWERDWVGHLPRITKEHFRCKGKKTNPPLKIQDRSDNVVYVADCGGIDGHSLPATQNQETISQTLIDILNEVQKETKARVVVTCGHRCPDHNRYARGTATSKHLVGAEVDFYVEDVPAKNAVEIVQNVYEDSKPLKQVSERVWVNREIKVTLVPKNEGRDIDNDHPYEYVCVELLFDKHLGKTVNYSWNRAHTGYMRW